MRRDEALNGCKPLSADENNTLEWKDAVLFSFEPFLSPNSVRTVLWGFQKGSVFCM